MSPQRNRGPLARGLRWFLAWVLFGLASLQSLAVTVAWWRGEIRPFGFWDGFWVLLLPVLMAVYLRYFSLFRKDCPACSADADRHPPSCSGTDKA